jgi:hypothetical protein
MGTTKMKIAVVTTFHEEGLKKYAQRMIDTFCTNWPEEITLHIYPEKCNPIVRNHNHVSLFSLDDVHELTEFKNRWKDVPKANGDVSGDPVRGGRKDSKKAFKWHAVRFAHKVYAIFHCARTTDADILLWMDADMVCHSAITREKVLELCSPSFDLCYLGRQGKYSECGLYAMNLRSPATKKFLETFQRYYDDAENGIFTLGEWHDSFVFDAVRKTVPELKQLNWSQQLGDLRPSKTNSVGEGHPLINCEWGGYLDHLKGDRKDHGHSLQTDLKVNRLEKYWSTFK